MKTRVEAMEAMFRIARIGPEAVVAARDDVLDAEYELAADQAGRIELLKQRVANAKEYESIIARQKHDARSSEADVLKARARRLGMEIKLVWERQ